MAATVASTIKTSGEIKLALAAHLVFSTHIVLVSKIDALTTVSYYLKVYLFSWQYYVSKPYSVVQNVHI